MKWRKIVFGRVKMWRFFSQSAIFIPAINFPRHKKPAINIPPKVFYILIAYIYFVRDNCQNNLSSHVFIVAQILHKFNLHEKLSQNFTTRIMSFLKFIINSVITFTVQPSLTAFKNSWWTKRCINCRFPSYFFHFYILSGSPQGIQFTQWCIEKIKPIYRVTAVRTRFYIFITVQQLIVQLLK